MFHRKQIPESYVVALMAALLVVLAAVPTALVMAAAHRRGLVWTGRTFFSPGDLALYLSYIQQVKDGAWLVTSNFSAEPGVPFFNWFFAALGLLARAFRATPLVVFQVARLALIPAFAFAAHRVAGLFLAERRERLLAVAFALFVTGWGTLFGGVLPVPPVDAARYDWPIDLWVAEAHVFTSALYSPLFLASWILLLHALGSLYVAYRDRRAAAALSGGLLALLLVLAHPYHAVTLVAVAAAGALALGRRHLVRRLFSAAAFIALVMPGVAYYWWLVQPERGVGVLPAATPQLTPALWAVLIGFGALVPLAAYGLYAWGWRDRRQKSTRPAFCFVAAWLVAQAALVYSPLAFQRRLLEGLAFPLAVLAAYGLADLLRRLARTWLGKAVDATAVVLLGAALLLPTSFNSLVRYVHAARANNPPIFYFTPSEQEAHAWLKENVSLGGGLVLSTMATGNDLGGWAGVRVFVGHWAQTADVDARMADAARFFSAATDDAWRREFLERWGITHVYVGARERALGAEFSGKEYLTPVYEGSEVVVYEARGKKTEDRRQETENK